MNIEVGNLLNITGFEFRNPQFSLWFSIVLQYLIVDTNWIQTHV